MSYLRIAFAVVVMVVWAVVVLGSYLRHEAPPGVEGLSAIMLAVVTGVFSSEFKKAIRGRKDILRRKLLDTLEEEKIVEEERLDDE